MNGRMGGKLRWAAEVLLFGLAVLDAWLGTEPEWWLSTVAVSVAVLALAVRRRHPYVAFVVTLPMLASYAVVAVLITLYGVAQHTRDRRVLALCSTAVAIGLAVPWPGKADMVSAPSIMVDAIYALMMGAAPAFLGQLVQARRDLSLRLTEINEAREHERELIAQTTLPADGDAATQRAIYRTVQEALTNVRKHAPGATAVVQLWHNEDKLGVTVTNGPPTRPTLSLPSAQHGLIGLHERAELLSGTLTSGPTPDGGFRVRLCLPMTGSL